MTTEGKRAPDFVSHERLVDLLSYDPNSGVFSRRIGRGAAAKGRRAGTIGSSGYLRIMIDGRSYLAHRLAWFYQTREWPAYEIDHKNQIKTDNRLSNLREAERSQNASNKRQSTGCLLPGVRRRGNRYIACITHKNNFQYLGMFDTQEEANAAYRETALALRGEFCAV